MEEAKEVQERINHRRRGRGDTLRQPTASDLGFRKEAIQTLKIGMLREFSVSRALLGSGMMRSGNNSKVEPRFHGVVLAARNPRTSREDKPEAFSEQGAGGSKLMSTNVSAERRRAVGFVVGSWRCGCGERKRPMRAFCDKCWAKVPADKKGQLVRMLRADSSLRSKRPGRYWVTGPCRK